MKKKMFKYLAVIGKALVIFLIFFGIFTISNFLITGDKKDLTNNYSGTMKNNEGIYLSSISDEFEIFLNKYGFSNLEIEGLDINKEKILDDSLIYSYSGVAKENYLYKLKQDISNFYGGEFELLNNISVNKNDDLILFTSFSHESLFDYTFDFNKEKTIWGVNEHSSSLLASNINIEYIKDANNYCVSIKDKKGNNLIYLKNNNFKSYEEAWDYFKSNKNELNQFVIGEDSVCFKSFDLNQIGLLPELTDLKQDSLSLQNYYVHTILKVNGLGEHPSELYNELDQSKIKYNFASDTILFIMKEGENNPFFAYKY